MGRAFFFFSLLLLFAAACGTDDGWPESQQYALVGVPQDGYPNYQERLMLVAINRARANPNVAGETKAACSTDYAARPPLMHNHKGSRCARFHCANCILNDGGLSHNSYCTLATDIASTFENGCDGKKSCACQPGTDHFSCTTLGGQGTSPSARCNLFGFSMGGEVGAAGYSDGWSAVWGWMSECAGEDGHRRILTGGYTQIGLGYYTGSTVCWSRLYFGDLSSASIAIYTLPAGVHRLRSASSYDFLVNYYHTGGAPQSIYLVLDGVCHSMTREIGTDTNATYKVNLSLSSGCHRYWFLARDAAGARKTYPEAGAWGVGGCTDYVADAPAAQCEQPEEPDAGDDSDAGPGGADPGYDAGYDAGPQGDGGEDPGYDAGYDAGTEDPGYDAGTEDAGVDAGYDAGYDAGTEDPGCDAEKDAEDGAFETENDQLADVEPDEIMAIKGSCSCSTPVQAHALFFPLLMLLLLQRRKLR